jgi:hypothetical protein
MEQSLLERYRNKTDEYLHDLMSRRNCLSHEWGVADQVLKERQKDIDDLKYYDDSLMSSHYCL